MAAIFAGILHGLDNAAVAGRGGRQRPGAGGLPFPIARAMRCGSLCKTISLRERLGERFCHVYHACKNDELLQFERLITETEIEWMLKNA
jgi:gamma-glutamylputrescine synthase